MGRLVEGGPAVLIGIILAHTVALLNCQPPVTIERTIELADRGGSCKVQTGPDRIEGAERNNHIIWTVTNGCGSTAEVGVGNFKHLDQGSRPKNPLELRPFPAIPAGESGNIRGRVRVLPNDDLGTYKYDVLINGAVELDPELVIER